MERQPLLKADRRAWEDSANDFINHHIVTVHGEDSFIYKARRRAQWFLSSKYGHYSVLILVSLDVGCIFGDFLITLHMCEHKNASREWQDVDDALGIVSLVFSSLFMLELMLSVWAFGFSYFKSKFHCFDATVIIAGFIVDVCLHGVIEEVGSLVVIGRLWRVFQIIEEFSEASEEQMDVLNERIEQLEHDNEEMKKEIDELKSRADGEVNGD